MTIETHPLEPFLPENAKVLFLGSFPPPKARWSMDFFYPNFQNDFWRVQGLIFHNNKFFFEAKGEKCFDLNRIIKHCKDHGLALYDTANSVCRLKNNASDNFLDILEPTDVFALLEKIPDCHTIVTTGGKASEELQAYFAVKGLVVEIPKVGEKTIISQAPVSSPLREGWNGVWYRMPSTSRAYPMKLEKKAEYYSLIDTIIWGNETPSKRGTISMMASNTVVFRNPEEN